MKVKNSIIIPAYNEEKRSARFIPGLIDYVKNNITNSEIIIVDDGSKDNTRDIIGKLISSKKASFAKIIGYSHNRGKGNAVAFGVKHAKGNKVLFIDADGSIEPNEIPRMLNKLDNYDVVSGNRYLDRRNIIQPRSREITGTLFNWYVEFFFRVNVHDSLCGFKGFKSKVAKDLFKDLMSPRWIFDVELLYKIRKRGYSLYLLPIKWKHKEGSKIKSLDPFKMAIQLILLRLRLIGGKTRW